MQRTGVQQVADDRQRFRGELPFRFARQTRASPTRERVGLVEADVANGRRGVQRLQPLQSEFAIERLSPVDRTSPAFALDCAPAVREPELGATVATVADEFEILAVRDEPVREGVRLDERAMTRQLVVETEV